MTARRNAGALLLGLAALSTCGNEQNRLRLYGNVDIREVQLAFHASGRIARLLVQEGTTLRRGQLVAELDPSRYAAAAAQTRADEANQQQVLQRLLRGSRPEEIAEVRARMRAAEANLQDAQLKYRRVELLYRKQAVTAQARDSAEATFKAARANVEAERQALRLALKGPRKEDIDAARARLEASQAARALAERELADTKLYAPEQGTVLDRILEPGDMASPQSPVFTVALDNPVWVRAYVSEPDLGKIAPGMRADVTTDSFPGRIYEGWIGFISPTAEFTPKSVETTELRSKLVYRVRIRVCNPENQLRLGMPVTVVVPLTQPGDGGVADKCRGP